MKLRTLTEKVNLELEANMKKEVIELGYRKYDEKNGRMVYSTFDLTTLMSELYEKTYIREVYPEITKIEDKLFLDLYMKDKCYELFKDDESFTEEEKVKIRNNLDKYIEDARKITNYYSFCNFTNRENTLEIFGIPFRVKRKRSGMISSWHYTNMMTVVKLEVFEECKDNMDSDIQDLYNSYIDKQRNIRKAENEASLLEYQEFVEKLRGLQISPNEFYNLMNKYKSLSYKATKLFEELIK